MKDSNVVFIYSRDDAIRDGALFDVSEMARQDGLKVPTVITAHLKNVLTTIPNEYESFEGRLHDVLFMARLRIITDIRKQEREGKEIDPGAIRKLHFSVLITTPAEPDPDKPENQKKELIKLIIAFNPYEGFTIMFPEDD
jgi:hypothetical protein